MELQWGFVPDHGAILYRMLMKDYSQALGEVTLLTNIVHCCCSVAKMCLTLCHPMDNKVLSKTSMCFRFWDFFHLADTLFPSVMCVWPMGCWSLSRVPTLHDPMDCSPPACSVHGTLQGRLVQQVAVPSSRGSSRPRDQTQDRTTLQAGSLPAEPPAEGESGMYWNRITDIYTQHLV